MAGSSGNGGFGYQAFLDGEAAKAPKDKGEAEEGKEGKEGKKGGKAGKSDGADTYESRKAKAAEADKRAADKSAEKEDLKRIAELRAQQRFDQKKKEVIQAGIKKMQENKKFEELAVNERQAAEDKARLERQQAEQKAIQERQQAEQRAWEANNSDNN